jgi:predicted dehydrogenase
MTTSYHPPVRWGILGTGRIAREFAQALAATPGAILAAVASRSQAAADAFGDAFGIPLRLPSYAALAASAAVDLVYIGTPHPQHAANALAMLDGGKGVLCEKPFALNLREAQAVIERARERGLFLMEAMWTRFLPALDEARRILASGELGEVSQGAADFGFAAPFDPAGRLFDPHLGGGALLDVGIYPLSILSDLLGPVEGVQAQAEIGATGVDLQTTFLLRHAGGALATGACSIKAASPIELTLSGAKGHLRIDAPFFRAASVTVAPQGGPARTIACPYLGNGYVHEAIEAQRCWQAGLPESPRMTHAQTLAQMALLDTIRRQIGVRYPNEADA